MSLRQIFRTSDALDDLDAIWSYIANDNLAAADRTLAELNDGFGLLARNPEIGEAQPLLADGSYRRYTCRSYVIYYRPIKHGIVIVRVLHGARDHKAIF